MALNDKQKAQIVSLYTGGTTVKEIEARLGINHSSVYFILRQYNIKPNRPRGRSSQARREKKLQGTHINAELAEEVTRLRRENKLLRDQIAAVRAIVG